MKTAAALLSLLLTAGAALAQDDPLKSADCGAALAALQSAREGNAAAPAVEALRGKAAQTCLGSANPPSRPGRVAQPPVAIPPPQIDVPPRVAPLPALAPPPPPVAIERAPQPATCDAGGCWTNDGSHLRHVPPTLVGPSGLCTQRAGQVFCP
jgi:hypothetical protein